MTVNQIYEIVNDATKASVGETAVLAEDLSNLVDIGNAVFNSGSYDKFTKALIDKVGKVVFRNDVYEGSAPKILMDSWEYGNILQKIRVGIPEATENESWNLVDGQSYDPNKFYQPVVTEKFYSSKVTFEVDRSITEEQLKSAFSSVGQMNGMLSALGVAVLNSFTIKTDALIMRAIDNMILETAADTTGVRHVNVLSAYNAASGKTLKAAAALYDLEFLKFATMTIHLYTKRLRTATVLFNAGHVLNFTPASRQHLVLLDRFASAAQVYLQSDTFHNDLVALPKYEEVSFWQGSGTDYGFESISKVIGKKASAGTSGTDVTVTGVIGVVFDEYAVAVSNFNRRTTSNTNGKAEFTNYFHKMDASYLNDLNENFVTFYIAD